VQEVTSSNSIGGIVFFLLGHTFCVHLFKTELLGNKILASKACIDGLF